MRFGYRDDPLVAATFRLTPARWVAAHVVTALKTPRWLIAVLLGMVVMSFTAVAAGRELEWEVVAHDPDHSLRQPVSPREIAEFGGVEDHVFVGELGLPSRALLPPRRVVLPTTPTFGVRHRW